MMERIGRGKEVKFSHGGNKYMVRRTSVWTFFIILPGRSTPAQMFVTEFDKEKVRKVDFIEEIVNRENQRKSAIAGSIWGGYKHASKNG